MNPKINFIRIMANMEVTQKLKNIRPMQLVVAAIIVSVAGGLLVDSCRDAERPELLDVPCNVSESLLKSRLVRFAIAITLLAYTALYLLS